MTEDGNIRLGWSIIVVGMVGSWISMIFGTIVTFTLYGGLLLGLAFNITAIVGALHVIAMQKHTINNLRVAFIDAITLEEE